METAGAVIKKKVCIIGGGPAALFMYKQFIDSGRTDFSISIFELKKTLGAGMPYSDAGAGIEHVTNVSGNEIPELKKSLEEWIKIQPASVLQEFNIDTENFNDYKVLPRLLFGKYLTAQFDSLLKQSKDRGIKTTVYLQTAVIDVKDNPADNTITLFTDQNKLYSFDIAIICTGHRWPSTYEGKIAGYFDSPYPPAKLHGLFNHPVAIRGSSLTAIDAIRTLGRKAGSFTKNAKGKIVFAVNDTHPDFRIVMHSRNGLLPALRFHLEDSHLSKEQLLSREDLLAIKNEHDGFIPLDIIFEENFKKPLFKKDEQFYQEIRMMNMEAFVEHVMKMREDIEPFDLFKGEFIQAEKSIQRQQSVYWKELLAILSFTMNYPAKYFSAEDMQRLQKHLMPLISVVIAFLPQSSAEELMALHDAGFLEIVAVGNDSKIETRESGGILYHFENAEGKNISVGYQTFIDCIGQPHLSLNEFPFQSMIRSETISPAMLKFKAADVSETMSVKEQDLYQEENGSSYLKVSGIAINDYFQVVDKYNAANERIYVMAVPYIGGYNPDYSGLDFCEEASRQVIKSIMK